VSDQRPEDRADPTASDDDARDAEPGPASQPPAIESAPPPSEPPPASEPAAILQRRAFLRQLTGEAVVTTARIAGLSTAVRQSLFAAGEAATRELDPGSAEPASDSIEPAPAASGPASTPPARTDPTARVVSASAPARSIELSPRQGALLTSAPTAVLGTNDAAGAPHLTSSIFHWDGSTIRLPSELFAARVARIDADPRVSVLVNDDASTAWVAMTGTAEIVSGAGAQDQMLPILRKYMKEDEADSSWAQMGSSADAVVIVFRPSRYVWRLD
jgi:hypothetical protein